MYLLISEFESYIAYSFIRKCSEQFKLHYLQAQIIIPMIYSNILNSH